MRTDEGCTADHLSAQREKIKKIKKLEKYLVTTKEYVSIHTLKPRGVCRSRIEGSERLIGILQWNSKKN